MTGKKKQTEPAKPREATSTTSGNEGERLRDERRFTVEGKTYVRHPEDDATFLVRPLIYNTTGTLNKYKSSVDTWVKPS